MINRRFLKFQRIKTFQTRKTLIIFAYGRILSFVRIVLYKGGYNAIKILNIPFGLV